MSQISPFGVGAGRSISGGPDDEDQRLRQRRLNEAQRAQQLRKEQLLHEQLDHAQQRAAQNAQQRQAEQADAQAAAFAAREAQRKSVEQQAVQRSRDTVAASVAGALERPSAAAANALPDTDAGPDGLPVDGGRADDAAALAAHDQLGAPGARLADTLEKLPVLIRQPGDSGLDQPLDLLLRSLQRARVNRALPPGAGEIAEMKGALDFMQGYIEASPLQHGSRERLVQMIGGIREELLALIAQVPVAPAAVAATQPASEVSREIQRAALAELRSGRHHRSSRVSEDDREAAEASAGSGQVVTGAAVAPVSAPAVDKSHTSLSKDADKRRDETPVTVTVRSV